MAKQINILSTKKLLPNQKQTLIDADFLVKDEDFIQTTIKNFKLDKINENLIFTSQNAVNAILKSNDLDILKNKPVFSVGIKTKDFLTENGFNVAVYTDYASDLAEIISLIYSNESFTFFCGNLRRDVLPETLLENKIIFNEIEVYETHLNSKKITTKLDAILFFSPSAIESYLKENKIGKEICFCIGDTTAETLEKKNILNIEIALSPTVEEVLNQCIFYYNSTNE